MNKRDFSAKNFCFSFFMLSEKKICNLEEKLTERLNFPKVWRDLRIVFLFIVFRLSKAAIDWLPSSPWSILFVNVFLGSSTKTRVDV